MKNERAKFQVELIFKVGEMRHEVKEVLLLFGPLTCYFTLGFGALALIF